MIQELKKENALLKEYVKTLEKQVRANAEERSALCKQMNTINQENFQLNRRISVQPQGPAQIAAQHYEERFKSECLKNVTLSKELSIAKVKNEELLNNCIGKDRRIEELIMQNQKIKEMEKIMTGLEYQSKSKKEEIQILKSNFLEKDRQINDFKKLVQEMEKEREEKRHLIIKSEQLERQAQSSVAQMQKIKLSLSQLQQKEKQWSCQTEILRKQNKQYQSIIAVLEKEKQSQLKSQQDKNSSLGKLIEQNKALTEHNNTLLQEKTELADSIRNLTEQKSRIQQQNECIAHDLETAKQELEDLSNQIKQFVAEKVHQKNKKNRTESCFKTHYEFNNAFQELKVQIEAIKSTHDPSNDPNDRSPTREPKQNTVFDLNSPSKWKSVEGKLSMLRSTQSMGRFR